MKKISVAVLAAAMLAGTVTAADIGFSYTGSHLFHSRGSTNPGSGNGEGEYVNYVGAYQCLSVSLATDVAGLVVDYDANNASLEPDEYYGWMNFGLPVGSLQVTAGKWTGRNLNRVVADRYDLDASNVEGFGLFELHKPGVINGTAGKDSANLTLGNIGLVGAWTLADVLPGTLMVKLGLARYYTGQKGTWNYNDANTGKSTDNEDSHRDTWRWNPDADSVSVKAGFAGEVSYRQEGAFGATFAVRSLNKHTHSFGAWISPELADTVQMTLGGTVAAVQLWDGTNKEWEEGAFEWGIDFRLRLQVTDDLSITTMNNLSSGRESGTSEGALWNMLNATYAFADNLKASFTVQSESDLFCPAYKKGDWDLTLTPALIIQASERTRVTAAVQGKAEGIRDYALKHITLNIPVVFSFNY